MRIASLVLLMALCSTTVIMGQTQTGTVSGLVTDSSGAEVPEAEVQLQNVERATTTTETTNPVGIYVFTSVYPGQYQIMVRKRGFKQVDLLGMTVNVQQHIQQNFRLEVGSAVESVTVEAGAFFFDRESAALGTTIDQTQISRLPTIGRDIYDFVQLSPGASPSFDQRGTGYAVNGQRSASGNFLLDGAQNNDTFVASVGMNVPLDAVQEYQLQTNNFTAEFGRNAGFTANVVTKSGSNSFHGGLYEFNRNSAFSANTYELNATGLPRPHFNRNQFGGTMGGPILRNKLFFFGSVESIRVRSSGGNVFFVPTTALLDISAPGSQAIFDPVQHGYAVPPNISTTNVVTETVCPFQVTCNSSTGSGYVTIPAFGQVSRTGAQDFGAGQPQNTYLATGRVDWNLNSKMAMYVRYAFEKDDIFAAASQPYSSSLDQPTLQQNQNVVLGLTRTWSSRWITETHVAYNRIKGPFNPLVPAAGFPNFFLQSEPATLPFGSVAFGGPQNVYQVFENAAWVKGAHTVKFGFDYIHLRDNRTYGIAQVPNAGFKTTQDFINGVMYNYEISIDPHDHFPGQTVTPPFGPPAFTRHFHYNEPALFIQDTWKVTPHLTLSPGLRWEYFGVLHSPGREKVLDSNYYYGPGSNYLERVANGSFIQTINIPGDLRGHFYLPQRDNFAPRLALAWDIVGNGKTVFRSGVGVFNDRNFGNVLFNVLLNPPSFAEVQLRNVPLTAAVLASPYAALGSAPITLQQTEARWLDQNLKTAYTTSWNATLERELVKTYVLGASYVGASGSRLYSINNLNPPGSGGLLNPSCVGVRFDDAGNAIGPDYTDCSALNPNVGALNNRGNLGHSTYHALQLRANSSEVHNLGLQFSVNYTFSHSIDSISSFFGDDPVANLISSGFLDAFHTKFDKGSSDFDIRHRVSANFVWQVPMVRHFSNAVMKQALGSWELSGILSFQTGSPFSLVDSGPPDFAGGQVTRPRVFGAFPKRVSLVPDATTPNQFLYVPVNNSDPTLQVYDSNGICNAAATPYKCEVSVNGPYSHTIGRNAFRRPGTQYYNMSILKTFPLPKEGMKIQLRGEFYSIFNHPNLYLNPASVDVNAHSFNVNSSGGPIAVSGVTASFGSPAKGGAVGRVGLIQGKAQPDNREIVLAMKFIF